MNSFKLYRRELRPRLTIFRVTVFPSARARHFVSLGRVACFITARAFTLSVPSCRKSALGRDAVASLKVTLAKSAVLARSIALLYHFVAVFKIKV